MTRTRKNAVPDSRTFQLLQHPVFRAEVNRFANAKCREAIKAGRLQFVPPRHTHSPARYIPRYAHLNFENRSGINDPAMYSMDLVDDPSSSALSAVFEIPGVKLNGISLQINDGNLVVRGERRPPYIITNSRQAVGSDSAVCIPQSDNQSSRFPVQELYFGYFYRSIPLPVGIQVIRHILTRP